MSKKDIRKKYKQGEYIKDGKLYYVGRWLKRYFIKNTIKRKHKFKDI